MAFEFEFKGFLEIMQELETLCDSNEMNNVNKKIVEGVSSKVVTEIKPKIPLSKDLNKSGKKPKGQIRQIPEKHSADNIPVSKYKKTKNGGYITIGWTEGDNQENFYYKFSEFGTSKLPPLHIFGDARDIAYKYLDEEGIKEYSQLLQKKLDGGT